MTLDRLVSIAHGWLPAFDRREEWEKHLIDQGSVAFIAYQEHVGSFARNAYDMKVHRQCFVEYSKLRATMAHVLGGHPTECRHTYYKSALLDKLRHENAKYFGFTSYQNMRQRFSDSDWQLEPDPVLQEKRRMMMENGPEGYAHFQAVYRDAAYSAIELEARLFDSEPGSFMSDLRGEAFATESFQYLECLGFARCSRNPGYSALTRPISKNEIMRWSVGERDSLFLGNNPAVFLPSLYIVDSKFKGTLATTKRETMLLELPVDGLVEGLREAYLYCSNLNELKSAVKAYCALLVEVIPCIDRAITEAGSQKRS